MFSVALQLHLFLTWTESHSQQYHYSKGALQSFNTITKGNTFSYL